jgi:1-deoxy-D-xylulose-5-phosphate reductoisomerase
VGTPFGRIDWATLGRLDFEPPDRVAFPCLDLAYEAGRRGGTAPAWLNAANEVAVDAFLGGRIGWSQIAEVLSDTLDRHDGSPATDLGTVIDVDRQARAAASAVIERRAGS